MINKVIVLGGGSAGFLCAISLKAKIKDLPVTVIRSKNQMGTAADFQRFPIRGQPGFLGSCHPRRFMFALIHAALPYGRLSLMDCIIAASSAAVCGAFNHSSQAGRRWIGQSLSGTRRPTGSRLWPKRDGRLSRS